MISGETRLVGLLGDPVSQSLSPLMQNAAFAARGLDWAYLPLLVTSERLEDAVRGLVALGFAGANVTTPHKLTVAKLVETDQQSVNTLVVRDGRVFGYSTDAAILAGLEFKRAAIIGGWRCGRSLSPRRCPRRRGFPAEAVPGLPMSRTSTWSSTQPPSARRFSIELGAGQTLVDLPYPPTATARAAEAAGARVIDGLDVLVAQGAAAFELWTGIAAPVEVMRAAVRAGG